MGKQENKRKNTDDLLRVRVYWCVCHNTSVRALAKRARDGAAPTLQKPRASAAETRALNHRPPSLRAPRTCAPSDNEKCKSGVDTTVF